MQIQRIIQYRRVLLQPPEVRRADLNVERTHLNVMKLLGVDFFRGMKHERQRLAGAAALAVGLGVAAAADETKIRVLMPVRRDALAGRVTGLVEQEAADFMAAEHPAVVMSPCQSRVHCPTPRPSPGTWLPGRKFSI